MRTEDILDDHDLDRALRDVLEPMPRSKAWERSQRDRLLSYIETGEIDVGPEPSGVLVRIAEIEPGNEWSSAGPSRRRLLGIGGTAAALILLVVGLVMTQRRDDPSPVQAPAMDPERSPANSTNAVGVEDTVSDGTDTAADPTATAPVSTATGFAPLVVGTPPTGYALLKVESSGAGVLTYGTDANSTELWLVVRDSTADPAHFDNQMRDLGRQSWEVDGRTVWSDGQLDGCLPDVCSVGVQWDDSTVVSLMWVDPEGGSIAPGSDQNSLLALLPTLTVDPSVWTNTPDVSAEASADPDVLLAPPVDAAVDSANALMGGPAGSMSGVLRSPGGSIMNLSLSRNPEPLGDIPAPVGSRTFGDLAVVGSFDSQIDTYRTSHVCWTLQVADGGGTGNAEPWRKEINDLFESMKPGDPFVELQLPPGWDVLSLDEPGPLFEVVLPVEGSDTSISILQSPAGGAAFAATLAAHNVEPVRFLGTDAWAGTFDFDPAATTVYWIHDGTYSTATASGLSVGQMEEIVAGLQTVTQKQWEDRFGMIEDLETGTGSCPPAALSIAAV